jgi:DNA repair protein RAD7
VPTTCRSCEHGTNQATDLEDDEYEKIFAVMPNVENVDLRNAGQLKENTLDYMIDRRVPLKHLQLIGSNLVTDEGWRKFFTYYGPSLLTLKLGWLDCSFDDETVSVLVNSCPNIQCLKLKKCFKIGDNALHSIAQLQNLQHLSLDFPQEVSEKKLVYIIDKIGPSLRTLSLEKFQDASDEFLAVIKEKCQQLSKLRLSENAVYTDQGFTYLFTDWSNPPLTFIDLSSNRDIDNTNPNGPEDPIGLASSSLQALMAHSGSKVERLDISSCRHISHEAFSKVFDGEKEYPELKDLNISFLPIADDFIVGCIFKSCPKLTKLTAFACFNVKDIRVPKGVALIGLPNAQENIVVQGNYTGEL